MNYSTILVVIAFFDVLLFLLVLFQRNKKIANKKIEALVITIIIFAIILYPFYNGFNISNKSEDWANFGSYAGGISSILTIGVLYLSMLQYKDYKNDKKKDDIDRKEKETLDWIKQLLRMREEDYQKLCVILEEERTDTGQLISKKEIYKREKVFMKLMKYIKKIVEYYERNKQKIVVNPDIKLNEFEISGISILIGLFEYFYNTAKVILIYNSMILKSISEIQNHNNRNMYKTIFINKLNKDEMKVFLICFEDKHFDNADDIDKIMEEFRIDNQSKIEVLEIKERFFESYSLLKKILDEQNLDKNSGR